LQLSLLGCERQPSRAKAHDHKVNSRLTAFRPQASLSPVSELNSRRSLLSSLNGGKRQDRKMAWNKVGTRDGDDYCRFSFILLASLSHLPHLSIAVQFPAAFPPCRGSRDRGSFSYLRLQQSLSGNNAATSDLERSIEGRVTWSHATVLERVHAAFWVILACPAMHATTMRPAICTSMGVLISIMSTRAARINVGSTTVSNSFTSHRLSSAKPRQLLRHGQQWSTATRTILATPGSAMLPKVADANGIRHTIF